jgi:anti-sigma-K factor RskA
MELDRIKILADKYFEGITSLDEEQELARLLDREENLPDEYIAVRMMLSSFNEIGKATPSEHVAPKVEHKPHKWLTINRRWVATAAAVVCIMFGATLLLTPTSKNQPETEPCYVCYMNGVKVEDDQVAYAEASRILGSVSEDMKLAMAEVNRLTHYTLIK